jgi:hypothetical protein
MQRLALVLITIVTAFGAERIEQKGQMPIEAWGMLCLELKDRNEELKAEIVAHRDGNPFDFIEQLEISAAEARSAVRAIAPSVPQADTLWMVWSRVEPHFLSVFVKQKSTNATTSHLAIKLKGKEWRVIERGIDEKFLVGSGAANVLVRTYVEFPNGDRPTLYELVVGIRDDFFKTNVFAPDYVPYVVIRPNATNFISVGISEFIPPPGADSRRQKWSTFVIPDENVRLGPVLSTNTYRLNDRSTKLEDL